MKIKILSDETKSKILKSSADILRMHAEIAGGRMCQDWSGEEARNPARLFSDSERDDITYNYEKDNSGLADYHPGLDFFHDEMSVSFLLAKALDDMAND